MSVYSFRDLVVWQKASDFSIEIYKTFSKSKDFSFRDQIQRAALSIPNNIAEGYARRSDKAFRNFLFIAKGSAAEVESMLVIATKLSYISSEEEIQLIKFTKFTNCSITLSISYS
ncbi:four helix bundle protein [Candidatus Saccharibacteria bacterium]|nr:four helix bundle protein [Candidatus Saccharibacteria bacterium]